MSSLHEHQQIIISDVLQPSQRGIDALHNAQQDFALSQELTEGVLGISPDSDLGQSADLLVLANQKTAEALALLGQISDGVQQIMGRAGVEVPALHMPSSVIADRVGLKDGEHIPAPADIQDTERKTTALPTGEYAQQATAFYGAILDNYAEKRARGGKDVAAAKQEWTAANQRMCEFALDVQDLQLAGQCFDYIDDAATRWDLVAKAYHAGYPLLAEDWQASLRLAIERGDDETLTLVAAHKAQASMALDRTKLADSPEERTEHFAEVDAAWQAASKLLENARSKGLVPEKPHGWSGAHRSGLEITPEEDIRSYMLDFVKLYCERGEFERAQAVGDHIKQISKEAEVYTLERSVEVSSKVGGFLPTIELRKLCYGLSAQEVIKSAKGWKWRYPESDCMASIAELFRYPTSYRPKTPDVNQACYFIETTYPEISLSGLQPDIGRNIEHTIRRSGWETAAQSYESNMWWQAKYHSPLSLLDDALQLARHEQRGKADALAKSQADIAEITDIRQSWQAEYPHADTLGVPELRQAKLDQLEAYLKRTYSSATVQQQVFEALLDAQTHINPHSTSVQERITKYLDEKLKMLRSIPNYEQELPDQLAALESIKQLLAK